MNEDATRSGTDPSIRSPLEELEVAVAGAGPVGPRRVRGQDCLVRQGPGPARYSRAAVIHARTLESSRHEEAVRPLVQGSARSQFAPLPMRRSWLVSRCGFALRRAWSRSGGGR